VPTGGHVRPKCQMTARRDRLLILFTNHLSVPGTLNSTWL
jgi:hypothetical protein